MYTNYHDNKTIGLGIVTKRRSSILAISVHCTMQRIVINLCWVRHKYYLRFFVNIFRII